MHLLSVQWPFFLLVNLRTLYLDHCILGKIAVIGELKKLEILSFVYSDIEQLPGEIGQLTRLKLLDLSNCSKLKVISPNVIASLSQLEELYIGNSFVEWEFERRTFERSNASLHELKHLSHLTTLEIHIEDAKILPKGLFFEKLTRYKIFIGDEWDWSGKYEFSRTLKLKLNNNICLESEIIMLLKRVEGLSLDEVQGVKNVLYELHEEGFPQLRHLKVQNNPHLLCLVDSTNWVPRDAFPVLESLFLHNLINLVKICHGQLAAASFCKLRIIKVRNCDELKNIFSISIVRYLQQLQKVDVIKCKNIEEIFTVGTDDDVNHSEVIDKIEFGHLRSLTLKFLPQLTSFYSKVKTANTGSNEITLEDEVSIQIFNDKVG
ncbi:hypothetical protein Patl1_26715 [Pistacia atlantica]|uniref:Uncharacterized protein n=1 Tax=Pistacia atlantica TaxID=434234 RepID=A0ACC1AZ10_9ROSI|nr:hypothetical protein Patl1_26715 [Pistacia atlantica]